MPRSQRRLNLLWKACPDDPIRLVYPVCHFLGPFAFERHADPGAMEVLCFLGCTNLDQELRRFNVRTFDGHAVTGHADTGEHLVTQFPRVQASIMVAGPKCAGQRSADCVDLFACHG